jgi:hypothetical protein
MYRARTFPLSSLLLLVVACATLACSSSESGGAAPEPLDDGQSTHALTVTPDGQPAFPIAGVGGAAGAGASTRLLLMRAGVECGVGKASFSTGETFAFAPQLDGTMLNFASTGDSYPLTRGGASAIPRTCDERLAQTEALVCMADKLAQIADAVGSLRWELPPSEAACTAAGVESKGNFAVPWTIPPQAEKDRFIARDLALHVLATAARLEGTALPVGGGAFTCAEVYGALDAQQPTPAMVDAAAART